MHGRKCAVRQQTTLPAAAACTQFASGATCGVADGASATFSACGATKLYDATQAAESIAGLFDSAAAKLCCAVSACAAVPLPQWPAALPWPCCLTHWLLLPAAVLGSTTRMQRAATPTPTTLLGRRLLPPARTTTPTTHPPPPSASPARRTRPPRPTAARCAPARQQAHALRRFVLWA